LLTPEVKLYEHTLVASELAGTAPAAPFLANAAFCFRLMFNVGRAQSLNKAVRAEHHQRNCKNKFLHEKSPDLCLTKL